MENEEKYYHECPECGQSTPWWQSRCNCGYEFERRFSTLLNESAAEIERLTKALAQAKTENESSFRAGALYEKAKNDAEWLEFFETLQLKNPYTNSLIHTREDFWKYRADVDKAKQRRELREKEKSSISDEKIQNPKEEAVKKPEHEQHIMWVTKWDSALETTLEFAYRISDLLIDKGVLPSDLYSANFYIIASALCTWAEQYLNQKHEWTIQYIDQLSAEYGNNADSLKNAMLATVSSVKHEVEGLNETQALNTFSATLLKLLAINKDASISTDIAALLISFSTSYITELEHSL